MKTCTKCNIVKELTEFYRHKNHKDGRSYNCKVCHQKARKQYYQDNKDKEKQLSALRVKNNPERHRAYYNNYYNNNRHKEIQRSRVKQLKRNQCMPEWADLDAIKIVYDEAKRLTLMHGIQYHVDHIIPLQGKLVCGLHIHTNLRVLPAKDNLSKSNTYDPITTDTGV